jgi:general L-amino acid transport system permease protein
MSTDTFQPIASRPPPASQLGWKAWVRRSFFDGWGNTALTVFTLIALLLVVPPLVLKRAV